MILSIETLSNELIYRILSHIDDITIVLSCRSVCQGLNSIIETYERYQVKSFLDKFFYILFSLNRN